MVRNPAHLLRTANFPRTAMFAFRTPNPCIFLLFTFFFTLQKKCSATPLFSSDRPYSVALFFTPKPVSPVFITPTKSAPSYTPLAFLLRCIQRKVCIRYAKAHAAWQSPELQWTESSENRAKAV